MDPMSFVNPSAPRPLLVRDSRYGRSRPSTRSPSISQFSHDGAGGDSNRFAVMARFLYRRVVSQGWILPNEDSEGAQCGIVLADGGEYHAEPAGIYPEMKDICRKLDIVALCAMRCDVTHHLLQRIPQDDGEITLSPHHVTIPVVESLQQIVSSDSRVRRRDFACFVRNERLLLVWSYNADELFAQASNMESKMVGMIWGSKISHLQFDSHRPQSRMRMSPNLKESFNEKFDSEIVSINPISSLDADNESLDLGAEDEEALKVPARPIVLTHSVMIGMAMCLLLVVESLAIRQIIVEIRYLGTAAYDRLALVVTLPIFMFMGMFIFTVIFGCLFQAVGPMQDIRSGNSRFYSSRAPERRRHANIKWPHITIQMPVYKEGLKGVIIPTVNSLLPAIKHYEQQGGTASIFVCEDGMQAVKPEIAEMRQRYYRANNIGWVARPKHGENGFVRGGRFKKASNMNYALNFSLRVEDELLRLLKARADELGCREEDLSIEIENELYDKAMQTIIDRDDGRTMAAGNVRMGEIILLIDCDTRVPIDCLSLAAMEMEESPEVAIIQHASGVMQVTNSIFENAITYFTNLVYLLIRFSVGNGDYAPFVGHNAFLRWKALQSVCFTAEDGRELFWSESHVSEDFDMSLRLQTAGFVVRLATYDNGEFKEGVSLTIFDELLRWEKYAYGCSELLFNPVYTWLWRGPFTSLFWRFLWSNMKISSKFTIIGYIGTYYSIAAALPLALVNYIITGLWANELDHAYTDSWNVLAGQLVIFLGVSPLIFAWYRHSIGQAKFWWALLESWKWLPFFVIFFGGLSWHLSYSLLAHMFCLPIEWSSTAKELEATGFFISINRVLTTFKWALLFCVPLAAGMIYLGQFAPYGWTIQSWPSIVPLANQVGGHIGLPLLSILL